VHLISSTSSLYFAFFLNRIETILYLQNKSFVSQCKKFGERKKSFFLLKKKTENRTEQLDGDDSKKITNTYV